MNTTTLTITHPEKVLFPDDGITKGELAAYYEAVAPLLLPHLAARPVTMERYPAGIGKPGFWQKDVSRGFPGWLERVEIQNKAGGSFYPVVRDVRSLLWLANQNCITPHVWTSRLPDLTQPDLCVFDLDPSRDEPDVLRRVLLTLRDLLTELGLASWVKTSGSKGFHVVVPLDGRATYGEVGRFAERVATRCSRASPTRSRRSSPRPTAAGASCSTSAATATAPRSPRPTRCARGRARPSRRPARGTRSSAATSARAASRCARWRSGSRPSAIRGRTCGAPTVARRGRREAPLVDLAEWRSCRNRSSTKRFGGRPKDLEDIRLLEALKREGA